MYGELSLNTSILNPRLVKRKLCVLLHKGCVVPYNATIRVYVMKVKTVHNATVLIVNFDTFNNLAFLSEKLHVHVRVHVSVQVHSSLFIDISVLGKRLRYFSRLYLFDL